MGLDRVILDIAAFVIIVNVYYTVCLSLDVFVHLKVVPLVVHKQSESRNHEQIAKMSIYAV